MTTNTRSAGFLGLVEREAGLSRPDAERAVRATLETLGERLSGGEARDLAEQLPPELAEPLLNDEKAQAFDLHEFLERVADREQVDLDQARDHVRAVFAALRRTVSPDELEDMASELPKEFDGLLRAAGPPPGGQPERPPELPADEFVRRVAERAGIDRTGALKATDAVLEVLGERISGGQADDLADQLAPELYPPLERGKIRSHGAARPLSLDDFVNAVAEREGTSPVQAREHARAVLSTLREAVSDREFADTLAQLPDDYRALLAPPATRGGRP